MDQSWEIIGIVVAVLMVVIGLRLLLKKPQPLAPVNAEDLHIDDISQQPVMPRHVRESLLNTSTPVALETASDTVAPTVVEEDIKTEEAKTDVLTPVVAEKTDPEELKAELAAEQELVEEAKAWQADQDKSLLDPDEDELLKVAETKPEIQSLKVSDETWDDEWEKESTVLDAHLSAQDRHDEESALATAQKIVALYVYPNPERALSGERTLKMLLKYGLRFGELSCFHRYEHAEHTSPLMFSVLRVNEDGAPTGFDLEALPTDEVRGLAFFLALPNPNAIQGFDMMASIAGLIARDTDGMVFDEQSLELTPQLRDHWRHYVIEYDPSQPVE